MNHGEGQSNDLALSVDTRKRARWSLEAGVVPSGHVTAVVSPIEFITLSAFAVRFINIVNRRFKTFVGADFVPAVSIVSFNRGTVRLNVTCGRWRFKVATNHNQRLDTFRSMLPPYKESESPVYT